MLKAPLNHPTDFIAKKYDSKPNYGDSLVVDKVLINPLEQIQELSQRTTYGVLIANRKDTLNAPTSIKESICGSFLKSRL